MIGKGKRNGNRRQGFRSLAWLLIAVMAAELFGLPGRGAAAQEAETFALAEELESEAEAASDEEASADAEAAVMEEAAATGDVADIGEAVDTDETAKIEETAAELPEEAAEAPSPAADVGEGAFLTEAQRETAEILAASLDDLDALTPGEDYLADGACFLANSEEEAAQVAAQYGAALQSFAEGVAVLSFVGESMEEVLRGVVEDVGLVQEAEDLFGEKGEEATLDGLARLDEALAEELSEIEISELPDVPIYPNHVSHISVTPNDDPLYSTSSVYPKGQWFHSSINSPGAWAKGADGSGVKVAVIDTGIDTSNNDLSCSRVLYVENSAFDGYAGYEYSSGEDDNGHGTHCAGIIAGLDNTVGGVGVAPRATLISIRAATRMGNLADSDIAIAIQMAVNEGVDVISMSFGGPGYNAAVNTKIQAAIKAGIVCVAAAGNESTNKKAYPACYDGVISVGAYACDDTLSSFSNYSSWVTLAAPGSDILATMVDSSSAYLRQQGAFWDTETGSCSYGKLNGTSMATPVVAGVAALVKSAHPAYSEAQIKKALVNSAPDKTYKYGSHTVTGGINALNAVGMELGDGGGSGEEKPTPVPVVKEEDYLVFTVGPSISVKAGKNVALGAVTSLNTKKNKITYAIESASGMITVNKSGTVKVNKKAAVGDSAKVTARCASLTTTTTVTVIDAKTPSAKFSLTADATTLSTVQDIGVNATRVYMSGGNVGRPYRLILSGKGIACFHVGSAERQSEYNVLSSEGVITAVWAKKSGTATLTAFATDGSGYKASIKLKCVTPLTDVNITYKGVPIYGELTMAQGASLPLKGAAVGTGTSKVTGKVSYVWSGANVSKNGKVKAPKTGGDFTVTVTATDQSGLTASKTLTIHPEMPYKLAFLGYYAKIAKGGYFYLNAVDSRADSEGNEYTTGVYYGIEGMPDLSMIWPNGCSTPLIGPKGFVQAGKKCLTYNTDYSSNEGGLYMISVSGPAVNNVVYDSYGVRCFTPGKKGKYKFIFTSLDGSGKTFTINFKVTRDGVSSDTAAEAGVTRLGAFE